MDEELQQNIQINPEGVQEIENTLAGMSDIIAEDEYQENRRAAIAAQDQQGLPTNDPRSEDDWGVKGLAKEGQSILSGGLRDTWESVTQFPERTYDALSGQMLKERQEPGGYQPEWTPLVNPENPIITKTWWGQLARGTVHFATLAVGTILTAKALGVTAPVWLSGMAGYSLLRAAGIGAVSDIISKESDAHNALGSLRDRYGLMDTPLSTKDTDHPVMMKFKNVVEGMGIGVIFDGALMAIGKGSKPVRNRIFKRNESIKSQQLKAGLEQLRSDEFRADKNRPVADPHQGAHLSEEDPFIVWENQKKIRTQWGAEDGDAGSVTTPMQKERIAKEGNLEPEVIDDVLKKLLSNEKYSRIIEETKGSRKKLVEWFGDSVAMHQRITNGRNPADMDAEEYLSELFESFNVYDKGTPEEIATITTRNVVAADLVVGTLLQEIQSRGIGARELAGFADLKSVDGPLDQILDTLLTALTETKRARITISDAFRQLKGGKRAYMEKTLAKEMVDTRESIQSILRIAKDEEGEELLMALFEAFSSMKTVNSLDDFDKWARKMIKGGEIEGKPQIGALVRGLEEMAIHSILSGPKTPIRAMMGTSTATFLRPVATVIGGTAQYPFTGDAATIRGGLASLNAMMEAIPESFEIFKTKLNSYWSGEVSTIKTRFAEYTRSDDNWEIIRRWAESDRASWGDKIWFKMANQARAWNNNSFLSYSTKLMAATDDSFRHILGRAKMREKALRSALEAQDKGILTAYREITPDLIRNYENDFYGQVFNADGSLKDEATKFAAREVTLTKELKGMAGSLNKVFNAHPLMKPFFYFARTGVNGLELTAKHTPGFNFLVEEWNHIARATPENLEDVVQYGITNAAELANAKALQTGRLAMGTSLISMTAWQWMNGNITGNGPIDRQQRQVWIDAGWRPRQIKLGDVWVSYDSFEPFAQTIAAVADVGDASQLMGDEWTQDNLLKMGLLLAQATVNKSYLAGLQSFVDLVGARPGQASRIVSGLMNNQVPMAGLRNSLGKVLNPHQKELSSGIADAIRNRNQISEYLLPAGMRLAVKKDFLNGRPIKDWDFMTRLWNELFPVSFNLDYTPGRKFLFNSGFDMRTSTYFAPDGTDLTKEPRIRSMFSDAMGTQGLDAILNGFAKNPKMLASLAERAKDIESGKRTQYENKDYYHNRILAKAFRKAEGKAWATIKSHPLIAPLIAEQRQTRIARRQKIQSSNPYSILNMQPK
tara:strand:- start:1109 stop:4801 length:3693 start_codon:yes stop_codon:yes gene_type:complete